LILLGNGHGAFQQPVSLNYHTGSAPRFAAVADFNGDGKPDMAVSHEDGTGNISIMLGNGDGTFQPPLTYAAGSGASMVTVGDFNGDGKPDLAVAHLCCEAGGNVSILLGNGDGTFQPQVTYPAGSYPIALAIGDFNGDGKLDLAVAVGLGVSILLGNGDGTFQGQVTYPAGAGPASVAVGDFNGDGKLDLAVISFGVAILLGNGDGTFQPPQFFPPAVGPFSVTVGDFNGDGKLDLAVALYDDNVAVAILLGNGDGTFQPAVGYAPTTLGSSDFVAIADLDGDGKQDLAIAVGGTGSILVLLGNGDGTFQHPIGFSTDYNAVGIAVGDFNLDGKPDLAVGTNSSVSLLTNTTAAAPE
jgi:uncharacterized protein (DUF2141 family)